MVKCNLNCGRDHPESSSSSTHGSMGASGGGGLNLTRYGSARGSLLTTAVDSVIRPNSTNQGRLEPTGFFRSDSEALTSESKTSDPDPRERKGNTTTTTPNPNGLHLQRSSSYRLNEFAAAFSSDLKSSSRGGGSSASSPSLVRHSSSPAGFLNALTADNGFSVTRRIGSRMPKGGSDGVCGISRLNSQLSFTRQDSLSQISEESEDDVNGMGTDSPRKAAHSYATASFGMRSWDDTNSIMFSSPQSKRAKSISTNVVNGLNIVESQLQFGLSQAALEVATMEKMIEIPHDSVPCKIRAKRGCATHPRSIAERERRTRISGKLKKLQDLVPNMDKQTSYADMLDLAVQHIKGLQTQVQKLHKELENCTCGCNRIT